MGVSLARPWFLLLLLPGALLLALRNGKHRFPPGGRGLILALRGFMFVALILALAQPSLVLAVKGRSVVYLLDQSRSVEGDYGGWIGDSLKTMAPKDRAAIIGFGRDTGLLKPFYMEGLPSLAPAVDREFTDLARALESGYSLLPGSGGRLVLISDGRENVGDALKIGETLAAAGVPVDVLPIPVPAKHDVALTDITLPKNTWPGQQVIAEVTVESTVATAAELTVSLGGSLAWRQQVEISPGIQTFSVPLTVDGQGLQRVRGTIDPATDAQTRNNQVEGLTFVQSPPRLLIIEGEKGKGGALKAALAGAGLAVDALPLGSANLSPVGLAGYRGVILVDVPAYKLTEAEITGLDAFVRVLGGGLLAVGGKSSFGPGLYQDTLLEAMLPVRMTVEDKEEIPGLDLILVIDRSGSMSGDKLNMAKNAAIQALEVLKKDDRIGVVAFDTAAEVVLSLTPLADKGKITDGIAGIGVGGGTAIYTGLSQGLSMLGGKEQRVKHLILLSDGQDGSTYDYNTLLAKAQEGSISISTIALGEGADVKLMNTLAAKGNGRSYVVIREGDLPGVFLQETVLAGGEWLVEEDFVPGLHHPAALALAADTPQFHGYVAATAKSLAEVLLTTHRDHPLLSRWQYGLGRTVAFTSDTFGLWSEEFLRHPGFASLWLDLVNWAVPQGQGTDIALESRLEGAGAEISALLGTPLEEGEKLTVTILDEEGEQKVLELLPVGGGRYAAALEQIPQGVYLLSASRLNEGVVTSHAQGGFVVPYPAEFALPGRSGGELLAELAQRTGGRVLTDPAEVFALAEAPNRQATDITWWLLLTALLAWPADIALRRLGGLPRPKGTHPSAAVSTKFDKKETEDETMARLLAAKRRRR